MVGFEVVFDIIVKIVGSLLLLGGTLVFIVAAFTLIAMGAPVWQCIILSLTALVCLTVCIGMCASAQGKL